MPPRHAGDMELERVPRFFIHNHTHLNFSWLRSCPDVISTLAGSGRQRLAAMYLHDLLLAHPQRTMDPASATLFYLPVYEYASTLAGRCRQTDHKQRMFRAAVTLAESQWFRRRAGYDHVFVSNAGRAIEQPVRNRMPRRAARSQRLRTAHEDIVLRCKLNV